MSAPRLEVLFVLPTLAVGGTERHVTALASGLVERGLGANVVALGGDGPLERPLTRSGARVQRLGLSGVKDPRAMPAIAAAIAALRPDVVHAFLFGFDLLAAWPARLLGVPFVVGSRRELATWMRRRHRLAQALGNAAVDRIVCCSEAARRHALVSERGDPSRYVTIRNGVDASRFHPDPARRKAARDGLGLLEGDLAVATVASLTPDKGHDVLLKALPSVLERVPHGVFLWAGEGPCRERLIAASSRLPPGRLRLLGLVADPAALLAAADLFVLPSRSEGLPNALLEAMASRVAAVASDVGGVNEATDGGRSAWLVPAGDPVALAAAVVTLLLDRERRQEAAARALACASRQGAAAMVEAHVALYSGGAPA